MADQLSNKELNVLVIHPERVIFEGKVRAITGRNDKGSFDVLPLHTNFVSIIKDKVTIVELNGQKREIPIEEAIMKVYENKVWVFVGIKENVTAEVIPAPFPQGVGLGKP